MRWSIVCVCLAAAGGIAVGQTAFKPLRGDRFKPLTYEEMTPEQKKLSDDLLNGPRHSMDGPFNVMLRSPEMGEAAQQLGLYFRFHTSLPTKLNEFVIMMMTRLWVVQFEFAAHHRLSLQAGLSPAVADAIAAGKRPTSMAPDEEAVYNFCM